MGAIVLSSEVAWAAGFFDGEGCVTGFVDRGGQTRVQLVVAQSGTTEHLERFRETVGVGNVSGPYFNGKRQGAFHWGISGKKAKMVMELLRPHLCSPKAAKYDTRFRDVVNGTMSPPPDVRGAPREELAWCAGFFDAEGCVTRSKPPADGSLRLSMTVMQAGDREQLDRFQRGVGVGTVGGPYHREGRQDTYQWYAGRDDVHLAMSRLRPFLCSPKVDKYDAYLGGVE